ncbi:AAA family ATPase, partial [Cardinium endosymbiont of Culicoides punctatus]|uniref:AAA family ATPase n=1 Tax=Cardinium endosymbiont of Culicoides punctatus TaxID=2304601 RepID=UPI001404EEFD
MNQDLEPKRAGTHLEPASIKRTHLSRLPIGDTDIASVIHSGYYADKTKLVGKLLLEGKTSFLVRPRRFGKSLFVNTIAAIAEGANKELFKDCFISNGEFEDENGDIIKYDWKKYPVIRLDFSGLNNTSSDKLEGDLIELLEDIALQYKVKITGKSLQTRFRRLINTLITLKKGYEPKIVLLIDEYDSPVINLNWDSQNYKDCMKVLSDFFATVKSCANNCQLIFVTGVYKFVLSGLGSGANILHDGDISLDEDVSDIVGYREEDIRALFKNNFDNICDRRTEITGIDQSTETVVKNLKKYYNGYRFSNSNKGPNVFNPTSILHFFKSGELLGYWKDTADTRLLVKQMQDNIERFS